MTEPATPPIAAPAKAPTVPVLRAHNVHKRFGATEVLKGIDLEVQEGEVVAIIGASGSGKTTFLRCVNLLEEYDAGRDRGRRRDHRLPHRRRAPPAPSARPRSRPSAPASAWCSRASTCSRT